MTIVIRTQSGNLVFNPKNIYLSEAENEDDDFSTYNLKSFNSGQSDDILGMYDSSERAQDIMFDIFNHLADISSTAEYVGCPVFAYEMPKG